VYYLGAIQTAFLNSFPSKVEFTGENRMVKRFLLPFFVVCAFVMVGCSKTESNENMSAGSSNNSNKAASSTNTSSTSGTTATSSTAGSGEKIGVADCDDFIAKYDACVTAHVPEQARAQYSASLKQWRDSWRQLAANPATKGTLASACKQAAEQAKTSMKTYGCEF